MTRTRRRPRAPWGPGPLGPDDHDPEPDGLEHRHVVDAVADRRAPLGAELDRVVALLGSVRHASPRRRGARPSRRDCGACRPRAGGPRAGRGFDRCAPRPLDEMGAVHDRSVHVEQQVVELERPSRRGSRAGSSRAGSNQARSHSVPVSTATGRSLHSRASDHSSASTMGLGLPVSASTLPGRDTPEPPRPRGLVRKAIGRRRRRPAASAASR